MIVNSLMINNGKEPFLYNQFLSKPRQNVCVFTTKVYMLSFKNFI